MLLKKIDPNWFPDENPTIKEGEFIDFFSDTTVLLADHTVEEIKVQCPSCDFKSSNVLDFALHVYNVHKKIGAEEKLPETKDVVGPKFVEPVVKKEEVKLPEVKTDFSMTPVKKAFKDMTDEEKKAWRIENLRKAREAAKAKKEAELTKEAVKEVISNASK